jgi:hypothetical protein
MNYRAWQRPIPDQDAYRRAGGRRAWNARRQIQRLLRRQQVVKLLRAGAVRARWPRRWGFIPAPSAATSRRCRRRGLSCVRTSADVCAEVGRPTATPLAASRRHYLGVSLVLSPP